MTLSERELVRRVASGETIKDASVASGFGKNPESARVLAHKALKKPQVAAALDRALEKAGAGLDKMARVVSEAMDATQSSMEINTTEGVKAIATPDHAIRLKAADLAGRWLGLGREAEGSGGAPTSIGIFVVNGLRARGLGLLADELEGA